MTKTRPWIRLYTEVPTDPKVQRLSPLLFKFWINCLCIAGRHDGPLPPAADIAWTLRLDLEKTGQYIKELSDAGLLDETPSGLMPHGWNERQYESDVSSNRVKRFRERHVKRDETVSCNVSSSLQKRHETESETAPEQSRYRADTEQSRYAGRTLEDWTELLYERHPKKKERVNVSRSLFLLTQHADARCRRAKVATIDELFRKIDAAHEQLSLSDDWRKENGKYAPKLGEWIDDEAYIGVRARDSPKRDPVLSDLPYYELGPRPAE